MLHINQMSEQLCQWGSRDASYNSGVSTMGNKECGTIEDVLDEIVLPSTIEWSSC
jgi:hypothetical protein